jgi:GT2 family glycosyltransferase
MRFPIHVSDRGSTSKRWQGPGGSSRPESTPPQAPTALDAIEVVLVAYRSRDHVAELLRSWPDELAVTVVENSNNADGVAELVRQRPGARYVDGGGQGFARGANRGAQAAERDYLVFVNPDTRPTADQLVALVEGLATDRTAAAHAASVAGGDGEIEMGTGGWEPSVGRTAAHAAGLHKWLRTGGLFAQPRLGEQVDVDWVCGACLAVRREQFLALGGFDDTFFVYAEDIAFGRRVRQAGLRSVLRPDVVVPHSAGSSGAPSLEMLRMRGASFAGYTRRYAPPFSAAVMRGLFAAGALLRAAAQALRLDLGGARLNVALASGVLTQRAYVGSVEVARTRFREMSARLAEDRTA